MIEEWKLLVYRRIIEDLYAKGVNIDDQRVIVEPMAMSLKIDEDTHREIEKEVMFPEIPGAEVPVVAGVNARPCNLGKANRIIKEIGRDEIAPIDILEACVRRYPERQPERWQLAQCHAMVGKTLRRIGLAKQALEHYRKAKQWSAPLRKSGKLRADHYDASIRELERLVGE